MKYRITAVCLILEGDDIHNGKWIDKKDLAKFNLNRPTEKLFKRLGYRGELNFYKNLI